jgi:phenylalanyl-tRNA synthetase alpha chain
MEGVRVFAPAEWQAAGAASGAAHAETELKAALEGLARHLFGDVEMRWVDAYFPFTTPSFELEILFRGEWLEVLGCGVVEKQILANAGRAPDDEAWAFGLGLERLAMVLFSIPDIRLFWTEDARFLKQFKAGDLAARFKPFSRFPPCFKDVAFWLGAEEGAFTENNLCEVVRGVAGDLVEEVKLIDSFTHPKTGRTSNCFRVAYRSMERSLTDEEVNAMQGEVRRLAAERLGIELR